MENYNSSILISKVNNMMKLIYNSISLNKLEDSIQFMSDKLYDKLKNKIDNNTNNGCRVIYDDIIINSEIKDTRVKEDYTYISVRCEIEYYKYYVSLTDNSVVSGDNEKKSNKILTVMLKKKNNSIGNDSVYKCLGCGTSMNITNGYKCPNCGRVFDLEEYDFIIDYMG